MDLNTMIRSTEQGGIVVSPALSHSVSPLIRRGDMLVCFFPELRNLWEEVKAAGSFKLVNAAVQTLQTLYSRSLDSALEEGKEGRHE